MSRYTQIKDGEWFAPTVSDWRMQCCDCGLVHRVNFRIDDGRVLMQAFRDARKTAAVRRARGES